MAFKFGKREVDFEYKDQSYNLVVDARLGSAFERHVDIHPLTLLIKINDSVLDKKMPPTGLMSDAFEFMLKKAGVPLSSVDFDEIYGEFYGGENQEEMTRILGDLLVLFVPINTTIPKPEPKTKGKSAAKK